MEINITHMIDDMDNMHAVSGSVLTHGPDAAIVTWNNAKDYAKSHPLIKTEDEKLLAKRYLEDFGAWDNQEMDTWSDIELNALIIQLIAGDLQEYATFESHEEWQNAAEQGQVSGNIFIGNDNQLYYYLGA